MEFRMQFSNEDDSTLEVNRQCNNNVDHISNQWTESPYQIRMTFSISAVSATVIVTILLTDAWAFEVPTNSCAIAIHKFLSESSPVFDANKKSLSLEIGECLFTHFMFAFIPWTSSLQFSSVWTWTLPLDRVFWVSSELLTKWEFKGKGKSKIQICLESHRYFGGSEFRWHQIWWPLNHQLLPKVRLWNHRGEPRNTFTTIFPTRF